MNILQKTRQFSKYLKTPLFKNTSRQIALQASPIHFILKSQPSLFQASRYGFSQAVEFQEKDFFSIIEQNQKQNIDSMSLFNQFNEKISEAKDISLIIDMCQYYQSTFNKRLENEKAIFVNEIALEIMAKVNQDQLNNYVRYLKLQQMKLFYEIGNFHESGQIAKSIFDELKESKNTVEAISLVNEIAIQMIDVKQFQVAHDILNILIDHNEKNNNRGYEDEDFYEISFLYSSCSYILQNFKDAAKYAMYCYQLIQKNNFPVEKPFNCLVVAYICYEQLKNVNEMKKIQEEIKKYPNVNLEQHNFQNFQLFNSLQRTSQFEEEYNSLKQQEELQQKKDVENGKVLVWNEKEEQKALSFLKNNQFDEGLAYLGQLLKKLDQKNDWLQAANIKERQAEFYRQKKQIDKSIEISLEVNKLLLENRNQIFAQDAITLLNLNHLKNGYYINKDFENSVYWGRKWTHYCFQNNIFSVFDQQVLISLFFHIESLKQIQRYNEALSYSYHVNRYLQSVEIDHSNLYKSILQLSMEQFDLQNKLKNQIESSFLAKRICEMIRPIKDQIKDLYHLYLKRATYLSFETNDNQGKDKYGQEYLQVKKDMKITPDDQILILEVNLYFTTKYLDSNQFEEAEKSNSESLEILKTCKYPEMKFQVLMVQAMIEAQFNRLDRIEACYKQVEELLQSDLKGNAQQLNIHQKVYQKAKCELYFQIKDYQTCLDLISKFISQNNDKELLQLYSKYLNEIKKNKQFQEKCEEIMKKYKIESTN
ncbi:hypothetical protein ABPG72_015208 [Tetrahymena utriculariae]